MKVSDAARDLLALCAIRVAKTSIDWTLIAREAMDDQGVDRMHRGIIVE